MRYRRNRSGGRARRAPADDVFERALIGDDNSKRSAFDPRHDRKTLQLCRQVQRALTLALMDGCDGELLGGLAIESVEAMGGAGHLVVRVAMTPHASAPVLDVTARLNARSASLRAEVAQSISRKRVPELSFVVVPMMPTPAEGGGHE